MANSFRSLLLLLGAVALSGCMLVAGQQQQRSVGEETGRAEASFVSAEGQEQRTVDLGLPGTVRVAASVTVGQGALRLDVLRPNGEVAMSISARPEQRVTGFVTVSSDERGLLRYRLVARGARDGGYELRYRRQ